MKSVLVIALVIGYAVAAQSASPAHELPPVVGVKIIHDPAVSFWETYQAAWSTILSAFLGFGGLIIVTAMGLRQSRKNQRTQAYEDRRTRIEHWDKEFNLQQRQWRENRVVEILQRESDARSLATALAAEIWVVRLKMTAFIQDAEEHAAAWEAFMEEKPGSRLTEDSYVVAWEARCSVYLANLDKLGLLPLGVTQDAVWIFGQVRRDSGSEKMYFGNVPERIRVNKRIAERLLIHVRQAEADLKAFAEGDVDELELPLPIPGETIDD